MAEVSFEVDGFSSKSLKREGCNITQSREPLAMKTKNFRRGKMKRIYLVKPLNNNSEES